MPSLGYLLLEVYCVRGCRYRCIVCECVECSACGAILCTTSTTPDWQNSEAERHCAPAAAPAAQPGPAPGSLPPQTAACGPPGAARCKVLSRPCQLLLAAAVLQASLLPRAARLRAAASVARVEVGLGALEAGDPEPVASGEIVVGHELRAQPLRVPKRSALRGTKVTKKAANLFLWQIYSSTPARPHKAATFGRRRPLPCAPCQS